MPETDGDRLIAYLEDQEAERAEARWSRLNNFKVGAFVLGAIVLALALSMIVIPWLATGQPTWRL